MSIRISDAFTQLGYVKKDISDVTDNDKVQWAQHVSDFIYKEMVGTDPERFIVSSTVNAVPGTTSYSLPADYFHSQVVGTGLFEVDSKGNDTNKRATPTTFGDNKEGYYISGSNIILTPPNWNQTQVYKFRYIPNAPIYTATTEYFTISKAVGGVEIIPNQFQEYLIRALDVQYTIWDEDPNAESLADFRFVRELNNIISNMRREGAAYNMPQMSDPF